MATTLSYPDSLRDGDADMGFTPFANETEVLDIGGLTIENRLDRVSISGDLDITLDKVGLEAVQQFRQLLVLVEQHMQAQHLPDKLDIEQVVMKPNPFA